MKTAKHLGFTLVELLVVIGIIAVLAGVLIASLSGGTESARAARCLSNMKNLANACQTYGMQNDYYPLAGNRAYLSMDESRGVNSAQKRYTEVPGWISTMTQGFYPSTSYRKGSPVSLYCGDDVQALYALTNGALWKLVSGNRETYVCPAHAKRAGSATKVRWSYLMSARFGWDSKGKAGSSGAGRVRYGSLANADKVLLFSEVPFSGFNGWQPEGEGGSEDTDAILQYSSSGVESSAPGANAGAGGSEELGVNHRVGRNGFTHVAFADGHVEKLQVPMKGKTPDTTQMRQLATWLATGTDVSFDGRQFKKLD